MGDRNAAKKRIAETVKKGSAGFMWSDLASEVAGDLGLDLGKHVKTAPAFARKLLLGPFPNRDFAEIQWDDANLELACHLIEYGVQHATTNLPIDPPKPEPAAGEGGEKTAKKKKNAPPKPPAAPAPPAPVTA